MKEEVTTNVTELLDTIDEKVVVIEEQLERLIAPTRYTVLKRFPVAFLLLTTFGVVATFLGLELLIAQVVWLYERPWLVLLVGVGTLVLTGTLYKKLS